MALVVTIGLLGVACSGSEASEPPSETTAAPQTTEDTAPADLGDDAADAAPASLNDALGGTQAVQDFAVVIDMRRYDGDEFTSFYDEVLAEAVAGAGARMELTGGFSFAPVDGLEAGAVDVDGNPLPSISIDHGLLAADPDTMEYPIAAAEWLLDQTGGVSSGLDPTVPLLVEITTADYTQSRTHVQLGDRSRLDLTFVETIAPGDDLEVVYYFGQTYPGDPAAEAGLGPHELFAQRWREGRLRFLGGPLGPHLHADRTVEAIEGSTVMTREQKKVLLSLREPEHLEAGDAPVVYCGPSGRCRERYYTGEVFEALEEDGWTIVRTSEDDRTGLPFVKMDDRYFVIIGGIGDTFELIEIDPTDIPHVIRTIRAFTECMQLATELNLANKSGRFPRANLSPFERYVLGVDLWGMPTAADGSDDDSETEPSPPPADVGCDGPDPIDEFAGPLPKSGMAYGDLHMYSFDGNHYANHAAGEFVLVERPAMQIRTEPWASGEIGVSVATAFAADLDGHRVSLHLDGAMWVDDEPLEPARGEAVPVGDGELLWWGDGWVLRWPDGTLVRVDLNVGSLVVVVEPVDKEMRGLLGDGDGDPTNDFVTRSGDQLDADVDRDVELFYGEYLESWRITADESLFHYEEGESTAAFTIEGFPTEPLTRDTLPADAAQQAETQCRLLGLRDGPALDACVVDVGATGDISFAQDAFLAQTVIEASEQGDEQAEPTGTTVSGDTNVLTIGTTTIAFGPEPPIVAPNSPAPRWECEVDEGSLIAVSTFQEVAESSWKITVRYFDEAAGASGEELTVRVDLNNQPHAWVNPAEHFADAIDTVALDGRTLTATGRMYVNDPPVIGLGPVNALPDDAELEPFQLSVTCAA